MPKSIFFENGLKWRLGRASGRYQHPFGDHLGPIWERFGHDFKQILQDKFDRKKYLRHTAYSMQHTAYSTQHTACSMQYTAHSMQHAAYRMKHTAYSIKLYAACSMQHTAYSIQHTAYNVRTRHFNSTDNLGGLRPPRPPQLGKACSIQHTA